MGDVPKAANEEEGGCSCEKVRERVLGHSRNFPAHVVLRRSQCLDSVSNHAEVKILLANISDNDGHVKSTENAKLHGYLSHLIKITEQRFAGAKDQEKKTNAIEINPKTYKGITAVRMSLAGATRGLGKDKSRYLLELCHKLSDTVAFKRRMLSEVVNFFMM